MKKLYVQGKREPVASIFQRDVKNALCVDKLTGHIVLIPNDINLQTEVIVPENERRFHIIKVLNKNYKF